MLGRSVVVFAVAFLCALSAVVDPARAEDPASAVAFGISLVPGVDPAVTDRGYFVYVLDPGGDGTGAVRLSNPGPEPVVVELAAVDATTAQTGGSDFAPSETRPTGVGAWLEFDQSRLTLAPGEQRAAGFTVRVPEDVAPGQYLAGIAAYAPGTAAERVVSQGENQATAIVDVQTRYVIGVEVDVPGDWTPSLTVEAVALIDQPSGPVVGVTLRNDGDTFLKPTGSLTVTDGAGATVLEYPFEMGTFVTGTDVTYPVAWSGGPDAGTYGARVELEYGDGQRATYEGTFAVGAGTGAAAAVAITSLDLTAARDEASGELQYVEVALNLDNPGPALPNVRLTLYATRDGHRVEAYVLGSSLTLQPGPNAVGQRYVAPNGWAPGVYAFAVALETIDPATGQVTVLAAQETEHAVVVE